MKYIDLRPLANDVYSARGVYQTSKLKLSGFPQGRINPTVIGPVKLRA